MTTRPRSRRPGRSRMRSTAPTRVRATATTNRIEDPVALESWEDRILTVQLPPTLLIDGELSPMEVGDIVDGSPVLYMKEYQAPLTSGPAWWSGSRGMWCGRGRVVMLDLTPCGLSCGEPHPYLEVAGRRFPLDWPQAEKLAGTEIEGWGGVYLDPALPTLGSRALQVVEIRRYQGLSESPRSTRVLDRLPHPDRIRSGGWYVADLAEPASD